MYQKADGSISYVKSELVKSTEGWERYCVTFTYPEDYTTLSSVMLGLENTPGTVPLPARNGSLPTRPQQWCRLSSRLWCIPGTGI